jgi:hypothetical protein
LKAPTASNCPSAEAALGRVAFPKAAPVSYFSTLKPSAFACQQSAFYFA